MFKADVGYLKDYIAKQIEDSGSFFVGIFDYG